MAAICGVIRTTPSCADWEAYAGDSNAILLEVLAGGEPVDLSQAVVVCQVRQEAGAVVAATAVVDVIAPEQGRVLLWFAEDALRGLLPGGSGSWDGVWDVQYTLNGFVTTLLAGRFRVVADVTVVP